MVKRFLQHTFNPLHVYCRLRAAGIGQTLGLRMCSFYERFVYRYLAS